MAFGALKAAASIKAKEVRDPQGVLHCPEASQCSGRALNKPGRSSHPRDILGSTPVFSLSELLWKHLQGKCFWRAALSQRQVPSTCWAAQPKLLITTASPRFRLLRACTFLQELAKVENFFFFFLFYNKPPPHQFWVQVSITAAADFYSVMCWISLCLKPTEHSPFLQTELSPKYIIFLFFNDQKA